MLPRVAGEACEVAPGVIALPDSFAWLPTSRVLVCADAHFAYEEVVGAALPLWSTADIVARIEAALERQSARELIFLGDVLHSARLGEGAARTVADALRRLRERCDVTIVAGNHEGSTRGFAHLGVTCESTERDGWTLVHGDRHAPAGSRVILGHLHPSLHLGGDSTTPVFLATRSLVVVPAATPYSPGLDALAREVLVALRPFGVRAGELELTASTHARVFPFGRLANVRSLLRRAPQPGGRSPRRRSLRPWDPSDS